MDLSLTFERVEMRTSQAAEKPISARIHERLVSGHDFAAW